MRAMCRRRTAGRVAEVLLGAILGMTTLGGVACSGGASGGTGAGGATSAGTGGTVSGGSGGTGSGSGGTGGGGLPGTGGGTSPGSGGAGTGGAAASGAAGGASSGGRGGAANGGRGTGGAALGGTSGTSGTSGSTGGGTGTAGAAGGPPIVDLFNGVDLTGWTANRESPAMGQTPGIVLTPAQALTIFKVENGTIRVYGDAADQSTQSRHTLVSTQSYSKYNLWVDYKWGTKKFAPYTDLTMFPRDAGILWNMHGDLTQVWPSSIEFQIKDGTTGDIFALYAQCTSLALNGGTVFAETGTTKLVNGSTGFVQHMRSANFEIPADWNTVQLQANAGAAVYIVNGHVVNRVLATMDKTGRPVTSGPIALQAEHAEVFYRNVRIQVLP